MRLAKYVHEQRGFILGEHWKSTSNLAPQIQDSDQETRREARCNRFLYSLFRILDLLTVRKKAIYKGCVLMQCWS